MYSTDFPPKKKRRNKEEFMTRKEKFPLSNNASADFFCRLFKIICIIIKHETTEETKSVSKLEQQSVDDFSCFEPGNFTRFNAINDNIIIYISKTKKTLLACDVLKVSNNHLLLQFPRLTKNKNKNKNPA